jgi:hypothetical protein
MLEPLSRQQAQGQGVVEITVMVTQRMTGGLRDWRAS